MSWSSILKSRRIEDTPIKDKRRVSSPDDLEMKKFPWNKDVNGILRILNVTLSNQGFFSEMKFQGNKLVMPRFLFDDSIFFKFLHNDLKRFHLDSHEMEMSQRKSRKHREQLEIDGFRIKAQNVEAGFHMGTTYGSKDLKLSTEYDFKGGILGLKLNEYIRTDRIFVTEIRNNYKDLIQYIAEQISEEARRLNLTDMETLKIVMLYLKKLQYNKLNSNPDLTSLSFSDFIGNANMSGAVKMLNHLSSHPEDNPIGLHTNDIYKLLIEGMSAFDETRSEYRGLIRLNLFSFLSNLIEDDIDSRASALATKMLLYPFWSRIQFIKQMFRNRSGSPDRHRRHPKTGKEETYYIPNQQIMRYFTDLAVRANHRARTRNENAWERRRLLGLMKTLGWYKAMNSGQKRSMAKFLENDEFRNIRMRKMVK